MEVGHDFPTLETAVRRHVVDALTLANGNQRHAAALLDVSRWKLARMIKRFGLRDLVTTMRNDSEHVRGTRMEAEVPEAARHSHDG